MTSQREKIEWAACANAALPLALQQCAVNSAMNTIVHKNNPTHLLGFPAEIRNRIYEYALIEDDNINVPPTGMAQPGVLRTCRSIRNEATKLYYANNKFNLAIQDYNGAAYVGFYKTIKLYDLHNTLASNIEMVFSGGPNWQNLLRWFEAAHTREIWSPLFDWDLSDATKELAAVATLFRMQVHTMGHLPWNQVEQTMAALRLMLVLLDPNWIID